MNIAIIIQKLTGGGAERMAAHLSILLEKEFNVFIIVFDNSNQTYENGGTIIDLKTKPSKRRIKKVFSFFIRIKKIRKIKKINNIDVSISFLRFASLINVLTKSSDKTIVSQRNLTSVYEGKKKADKLIINYIMKKANFVVCLSKYVENDLLSHFNVPQSKTIVIYNSIMNQKYDLSFPFSDFEKQNDFFYFCNVGRLNEQKGQWHLLKSFSLITKEFDNVKLIIVGDGPLLAELKELSNHLGISSKVTFTGFKKNPYKYMYNSNCFVFSSLYEGLGNVLLEALKYNLPIISSDCKAGPREILAPETIYPSKYLNIEFSEFGILTPPFSIEDFVLNEDYSHEEKLFANAMKEMVINSKLRNSYIKKTNERSSHFDEDIIKKQWVELIKRIYNS